MVLSRSLFVAVTMAAMAVWVTGCDKPDAGQPDTPVEAGEEGGDEVGDGGEHGHEHAEGEGEHAGHEHAEGEHAEGEHAGHEHAEGEHEHKDGDEHAEGEHADHEHGDEAKDDSAKVEAKIKESLAMLTDEERALAVKQSICPVTGGQLGAMGKPIKLEVEGTELFICCPGCKAPILKSPEKFLAKLNK